MPVILTNINNYIREGRKIFAWLIDPDKYNHTSLIESLVLAEKSTPDLILIGGSMSLKNGISELIGVIKDKIDIPVVLFPGNVLQVNEHADGILFLSLISGRNPEYLIGKHVEIAYFLKNLNIEVIPTGYMIIDTGQRTTVSYISNTVPIPYNKTDIAVSTAIAGELLGLKMIFLEGGSGAMKPIDLKMIRKVKDHINIPLIVGGGIKSTSQMSDAFQAGADIVVVGNAIEDNPDLLAQFAETANTFPHSS